MTSPFGLRRHPVTGKSGAFHKGIDLALTPGEKGVIHAPVSGVLKWSEEDHGGLVAQLRSGSLEIRILHMSERIASGRIEAGEAIGRIGDSGRTTGVHAHIELRAEGQSGRLLLDPTPFISDVVTSDE